ncbi:hypothetical protein LTR36_004223 [Oleoguttula mirabilis]|uniref:Uncharacterized protein n=1 Tax=Oleoguttula mirabilis TaxID=1507867 RepID=A0AAV9JGL7_9PEZI|nr:hypothetical protein LTR36_004223 [Oleoguttula mirabilis]
MALFPLSFEGGCLARALGNTAAQRKLNAPETFMPGETSLYEVEDTMKGQPPHRRRQAQFAVCPDPSPIIGSEGTDEPDYHYDCGVSGVG